MRHIIAISGGKDSTALAIHLRGRFENPEYVFADTGRELPEVYAFLENLECVLGAKIVRLTDGWYCAACDDYGTDPRATECPNCGGEVQQRDFNYYVKRWSNEKDGPLLPGPHNRWCTKHLKLRPFERFIGQDIASVYIGIRADEDRTGNYGLKCNIAYKYPFIKDGIDLNGVMKILKDADIKLPAFYRWRSTGGCWCCPYQRKRDWINLQREHPDLFEAACVEEERSKYTWRQGSSLRGMVREARAQLTLFGEEIFEYNDTGPDLPCVICAK